MKRAAAASFLFLSLFAVLPCRGAVDVNDEVTVACWYGGGKVRAPALSRDPSRERSAWAADLRNISALGFNAVKVWVDWSTVERVRGRFDFSALEQVLSLIEEQSLPLRVLVQVYADSAPDWVAATLGPDAEFVGSNDRHIHSQSAPGFCFDHPNVRAYVLEFYRQVGLAAARHHELISGFDVWSEPHLVSWVWFWESSMSSAETFFCYCNNSMNRFRTWIKERYDGDLDRINSAWYRTFDSWDEVVAPRFGTIISYGDFLDYLYHYIPHVLAENLKLKAQAVRRGFGDHNGQNVVVTSHSSNPTIIGTPFDDYGMADDWQMDEALRLAFEELDDLPTLPLYGTSVYPIHAAASLGGRDGTALAFAYTGAYSASRRRGFFVGELQAGQGATGIKVNVPVTADHHRDWMWSLLAHGARSISFFSYYPMSAGYESNGYGLVHLDGSLTDRARSSGAIASIVAKHQALFAHSRPEAAQVSILFNPQAYYLGGNTAGPAGSVLTSTRGIFSALYSLSSSVPVEFVHTDDVERGYLLEHGIKLLIMPFPISLSATTATALETFISAGGYVVSEARTGWTEESGAASERIPGLGLDAVFGAHEEELRPVVSGAACQFTFAADAPAGLAGITVQSATYEEILVPAKGAKVLATFAADGAPAVVEYSSSNGGGKTILIGSFVGISAMNGDSGAKQAINALLEWAGVESAVKKISGCPGLVVRMLQSESEGTTVISVHRGTANCTDATIELAASVTAAKAFDITNNDAPLVFEGGVLHLPPIGPKEVLAAHLK